MTTCRDARLRSNYLGTVFLALGSVLLALPARAQSQNRDGFAVERLYSTVGACRSVAIGDYDGDGDNDLAMAGARTPALGDLDGDGALDLAFPSIYTGEVAFMFGQRSVTLRKPSKPSARHVLADDTSQASLRLDPVAPHQGASSLEVRFTLPGSAPVSLEMFDITGRRIQERWAPRGASGEQAMEFSLDRSLRSGVYWLRLRQGAAVATRRFTIVR
ncbi:MAG: T9SS type A sorting domain-containing protein [Candidatus Eisenbacteria bacterium]|uniref:T9SS type A sorting domain-containing protein n=1 Tax=Eiseniibacteriota bacterium TaxID=2212470 RepID=A0A849SBF3_UNCEI|nr:T9SS type A sorting domain-containing protein [Candidatus Eisenbacteria bacterium]